jgi:recombination protein RecT
MNAVVAAPQREAYTDFQQVCRTGKISEVLAHPEMRMRLIQAAPKHMSADRMLRVAALAIQKTPDLLKCGTTSLLGALMVCASLGLEPNTTLGHAYLIPFAANRKIKNQAGKEEWVKVYDVTLIIGYKGLIDLARRSGSMSSIHADVVYPGDEFSFEFGSRQHLHHRPTGDRSKTPLWAYCHAALKDGEAFSVLPWTEVMKIRNASQGYKAVADGANSSEEWKKKKYDASPWVAHLHEMASKTALRNLAKYLPMSIEFASAASLDEMSETGRADLSLAATMTAVEDMVDATAIEDQSGEQEKADFVEQGMQQQTQQGEKAPAEPEQKGDGADQQQNAPQQSAKAPRKTKAASPPPPPVEPVEPAKAASDAPAKPQGRIVITGQSGVEMVEMGLAPKDKTPDKDDEAMPFLVSVTYSDGSKSPQFDLPDAKGDFEQEFCSSLDELGTKGTDAVLAFITANVGIGKEIFSLMPNLAARLQAHITAVKELAKEVDAAAEEEAAKAEAAAGDPPSEELAGDEPEEDDGSQPSFV